MSQRHRREVTLESRLSTQPASIAVRVPHYLLSRLLSIVATIVYTMISECDRLARTELGSLL
jgi:hypothetical protein